MSNSHRWRARFRLISKVCPRTASVLTLCLFVSPVFSQNETNLWDGLEQIPPSRGPGSAWVQPQVFRGVNLRHGALRPLLNRAARQSARPAALSQDVIALPLPDGTTAHFRFVEAPVMAPELAAQFPEIKTYVGQGVEESKATVRFDLTPAGFHAQILSPNGAVYIDPYFRGDTNVYACYYKRDYRRSADGFQCLLAGKDAGSGTTAAAGGGAVALA